MWFIERIREGMEILEINKTPEAKEELSAKASLLSKLHSNVLTPEKIPEFFIPPRLACRGSRNAESTSTQTQLEALQNSHVPPARDNTLRPLPHTEAGNVGAARPGGGWGEAALGVGALCGAHYGLAGLSESPNTRRKESLFFAQFKGRPLERTGLRHGGSPPTKAQMDQGSIGSDTPSSSDSSPLSSPAFTRSVSSSALFRLFGVEQPNSHLSSAASMLSLGSDCGWNQKECLFMENHLKEGVENAGKTAQSEGSADPPTSVTTAVRLVPATSKSPVPSTSLAPPPSLDLLCCQERLQKEHVLSLEGRGRVRLSAERDHSGSTLRVRVVSVEDLHEGAPGGRLVHCCVSLCLTPGKWQRQNSAIIKNCRNPVFNEDFFFTELEEAGFHSLALHLKVLDKTSSLKRAMVLGFASKPLSQLLPL